METKKELKKKKERRNKIAIISLLIFLCFTISNAQEHCDFEDFIKEEMDYINGVFNSKGRLNLGKTMLNSEGGIESNSAEMINLNAEGKIHRNSNENTKF